MKFKFISATIVGLILAVTFLPNVANAGLIKSYDFNGDLTDTLGNGVDLLGLGGSISGGQYHFGAAQGLIMNSALASTTSYAFEVGFSASSWRSGWNSLVNFSDNGTSDRALYYNGYQGQGVGVYDYNSSTYASGSLLQNTPYVLGFVNNNGSYTISINGTSVTSYDTNGYTSPSALNTLRFFKDNGSENFAGSVDFIRIHSDASSFGQVATVPEPSTLAIFALGMIGLVSRRFKKQA
ncbi:MAG: hypothetical protein ACJAS9_003444 [Polaribacter sp.]|jgi:hypothetical protein